VRAGTAQAALRRARRALFGPTVASMVSSRAIAFDDQAKDFLDNLELKRVLADIARMLGRKIDVVGFDACLMSMVEVAYQIRDTVRITCGSEEEEPDEGWPYDTILRALEARPSMTARELAGVVVQKYLASYRPDDGVTFAATDLAAIGPLADAVNRAGRVLTAALREARARSAIMAVRAQVQEYSAPYDEYCDLADLCDLLAGRVAHPGLGAACDAVRAALGRVVVAAGARGRGVAHSHGLSIYFPKRAVCRRYATLDFARRRGWAAFIGDYTRRVGRRP
jgi:Clostripain family